MRTRLYVCAGAALVSWAAVCAAHHNSGAVFDVDREMTVEGVVARYDWRNPHIYIYVDGTTADGTTAEWRIEAGPLGIMRRFGWTADSLTVGDHVSVIANPSRTTGRTSGYLVALETDRGALPSTRGELAIERLPAQEGPGFQAPMSLVGIWTTLLDIDVLGPFDDPGPDSLTPAGVVSLESFDETTMHPGLSCTPFTAPATMLIPDIKAIERAGETLVIRSEFGGAERIVHLAGDPPATPSIQGRSIGRWDGNTLVVDTLGFAAHRAGNAFGVASSPQKRLREEFTLDPDRSTLTYRFELSNPVYLAGPMTGETRWVYRPDLDYAGLPCNRQNARSFVDD